MSDKSLFYKRASIRNFSIILFGFISHPKNRGHDVNHVVIQENTVSMQETDKTVRVECAFTAEDQTVSFRPTGLGDGRDDTGGISVT